MSSIFAGYMKELIGAASRSGECRDTDSRSLRICELSRDKKEKFENVYEWDYEHHGRYQNVSNAKGVYSLSRSICLDIERWISVLEINRTSKKPYSLSGCAYTDYRKAKEKDEEGRKCIPERKKVEWERFRSQREIQLWGAEARALVACMDIVKIILLELGLTVTGKEVIDDQSETTNYCQKIYEGLRAWGGEEIARKIMSQWTLTTGSKEGGQPEYILPGRDLYEIVTESVSGLDKGDKSLRCDWQEQEATDKGGEGGEYKTSVAEDQGGAPRSEVLTKILTAFRDEGELSKRTQVRKRKRLTPGGGYLRGALHQLGATRSREASEGTHITHCGV
ncbi:hypothetical protein C922_05470 [Plasmodium inui San Antonio 1]|uniref:Uncharacterized protein n=1 Tax=Plasmodium inui San Antonio 1 TaxID=1237626 RepID=W7A4X3_9APIC|nr:hypothetical protein C922_05470 [Plasmodium inui San Antonio 1]EUD64154.1 hypothetical protein C922_05470 [Plasmodium inui San Antonio 1]